ncbi:hypothetical protein [Polyangium jinanense]|uniref:Uncharacterized protein n=1 Tax=Polyangium jinanense TaxID=2829994 RepID=A0A9X3WY81_9BACT|nr:hypothetical protein [Polyangium jinanense]MDC3952663.1 hypothetical protein [Polyangium jinanense]MDC3980282.1 hypothetical protein [Polyangium jinanense]
MKQISSADEVWYGVGFGLNGEVVVFDGKTGAVTSSAEGGGGTPRDVSVDPDGTRLWVFEENEDASGGEIRVCPLDAGAVGPCEHAAWVDGGAALFATDEGLWVFEHATYGSRWKVLQEGTIAKGVYAPRPASVWREGDRVEVLSYGVSDDRLTRLSGTMTANGLVVTTGLDLGAPALVPPTARFVPLSAESGLLWDVVGGDVAMRKVDAAGAAAAVMLGVGPGIERIEAAEVLSGAALVLSTNTLWVVEPGEENGGPNVTTVALGGEVRRAGTFFSRDLVTAEDRALVATDQGVRAIVVEKDGGSVFLDDQFDGGPLRGPLGVVHAAN